MLNFIQFFLYIFSRQGKSALIPISLVTKSCRAAELFYAYYFSDNRLRAWVFLRAPKAKNNGVHTHQIHTRIHIYPNEHARGAFIIHLVCVMNLSLTNSILFEASLLTK